MKKTIIMTLLIGLSFLCGCGQNATGGEQPKPTLPSQGDTLFTELPEVGEVDLSGEEIGGLLEDPLPTGDVLEIPYEAPEYLALNRMESVGMLERDMVFCVDETTGNVYFVNMGKDYYIYRIKEGEVELAVELPAKELCMWDGTLYFMLDSYGKYKLAGGQEGDIYAYSPADGTATLVYEADAMLGEIGQRLCCDENGLYFSASEPEMLNGYTVLREKFYHLPYGEKEPVEDKNQSTYPGWGEYKLVWAQTDKGNLYKLQHKSGETDNVMDLDMEGLSNCWITGNTLYYTKGLMVGIRDIVTGETKIFDFSSVVGPQSVLNVYENYLYAIDSFTMTEDSVWASRSGFLFRYHMATGQVSSYDFGGSTEALYTTGDEVYALRSQGGTEPRIVRIKPEQVTTTEVGEFSLVSEIGMEELTD